MPKSETTTPLPIYESPPVVETVLGFQFERLPRFSNAHLGMFWQQLGISDWPDTYDAPQLQNQFERFGDSAQWAKRLKLQLTSIPAGRLQIKNAAGDRMIQVQNSRLHFNWLATAGRPYPRYESLKREFGEILQNFQRFAAQHRFGEIQPNQWEVTYINRIPQGTVWATPEDWGFCKLLLPLPKLGSIAKFESFTGEWHLAIPNEKGRLHIEWEHGVDSQSGRRQEFIQLTLTARGAVEVEGGNSAEKVQCGLDLGRETIVRTFERIMDDNANQFWGLENVVH